MYENRGLGRYVPGLLLLIAISITSYVLERTIPSISGLLLAIGIGALLANTIGLQQWFKPGVRLHPLLLETAIVLLGVRLSLEAILRTGPIVLLLVVFTVGFTLLVVELLAQKVFHITEKTGSLLAAGASVCGVSAVVAVASGIKAEKEQIAYVAGTIILFDAVTLVTFPIIGSALGLSGQTFGVWAGLSMFSTGPVVAAGFTHSPAAGEWATITKLVRNSLIGLVALLYVMKYAERTDETVDGSVGRRVWEQVPKFLIGFLMVVVLANIGVLSDAQTDAIAVSSDWLFLLAFAGLGFDIQAKKIRQAGVKPVLVTLLALFTTSIVLLLLLVSLMGW